jgi:integrase
MAGRLIRAHDGKSAVRDRQYPCRLDPAILRQPNEIQSCSQFIVVEDDGLAIEFLHFRNRLAGIQKALNVHTLRHTYATHLLEDGLDIVSIKELPGHARIETTLVYLHVTRFARVAPFSPLDRLYEDRW